jgi:small-conductance mechanosensitive channel
MAAPGPGRRLGGRRPAPRGGDQRRRVGARRPRGRRPRRAGAASGARTSLRHFRQATILAVALTALLLLLFFPAGETPAATQEPAPAPAAIPDTVAVIEEIPTAELAVEEEVAPEQTLSPDTLFRAAVEEARQTALDLWYGFLGNLPKFVVVLLILLLAWVAVRIVRPLMRRALHQWERSNATIALVGIAIWLFAIGVAVSVIAGDIRALVGSLGLIGLALSWALQTPIESFTGWLLNSFQGYYRVGDRIAVGEVFGDVFQIDFLTTTVWEIGSLERPGFVQAEQPTGRLITFPNSEVLAGSIINLTRDFPFVWDELTVPVGNRSDLAYASAVMQRVAAEHLGDYMAEPAAVYEGILRGVRLEVSVAREPQVFVSLDDSWTNLTFRYLFAARERRKWKSELAAAVMAELNREEHRERIISVFPRRQIQIIGPDGKAAALPWTDGGSGEEP